MEPTLPADAAPAEAPEPSMSLLQRLVAVFVRPGGAWFGLRTHAQWWFPLIIVVLAGAGMAAALHNRALVPMLSDQWEEQVANGKMTPEQVQKMEEFFAGPAGLAVSVGQQSVAIVILYFLWALVIWFGAGFVLGRPLKYRQALEVGCWSGLITIPAQVLTSVIAWSRETMQDVHVGFGILLPQVDSPSKLHRILGGVLDAVGPLSIWWLFVVIVGAAALSGAPRKSVAWVLGGLYIVIVLLFTGLGALFAPAA